MFSLGFPLEIYAVSFVQPPPTVFLDSFKVSLDCFSPFFDLNSAASSTGLINSVLLGVVSNFLCRPNCNSV